MADEKYEGPDLDASQVNALLQARATGRVGAILSDAGVPAKTGGRVLAMLRGFAGQGFLMERPLVDEEAKSVVYFDLAPRANLDFLDLAAIQILRAFAEEFRQLNTTIEVARKANESTTGQLRELEALLTTLERELRSVATGVAVLGARALIECEPRKGPDAQMSIADEAATLSAKLLEIIK
jgi:hypothetical protein